MKTFYKLDEILTAFIGNFNCADVINFDLSEKKMKCQKRYHSIWKHHGWCQIANRFKGVKTKVPCDTFILCFLRSHFLVPPTKMCNIFIW